MNLRRYFWGALAGAVLSIPANAIGWFCYNLVRPVERSMVTAAGLATWLAASDAVRQAPLAASCGVLVTLAIFRTPPSVSIPVAGTLSAICGGFGWWWLMRWSSSFNANTIGEAMAVSWGATAILAASIVVARITASNHQPNAAAVQQ